MDLENKIDLLLERTQEQPPDIMNVKAVALYMGISQSTIRKYLQNEAIPYHKANGSLFFLRAEIYDWLLNS